MVSHPEKCGNMGWQVSPTLDGSTWRPSRESEAPGEPQASHGINRQTQVILVPKSCWGPYNRDALLRSCVASPPMENAASC